MNALAGRHRHTEPVLRRLGRPERDARRRRRDVRLDADGAGVRHRQLRLLPAGRHQSRCQRVELAGDRARRVAARAGAAEGRREDRRRRPVADRIRRPGRRASGGAARAGLGAAAGHGQGDPRRGPRTPAGLRRTRHRRSRNCASSSATPISTTWHRGATYRARTSNRCAREFATRPRRDGGHPHRCLPASGRHHRRVAGPRAQRDHRADGPTGRPALRTRLRRRASGWPA